MAKIGRNEPCPCGSGKKFKRCCGAGTQYVSPPAAAPQILSQAQDAADAAQMDALLKRAKQAARLALRKGDEGEAVTAVVAVLKNDDFFDAREARREARLIVAEESGRMAAESDMKNAAARATRAGAKAFKGSQTLGQDVIAAREAARAAILASFAEGGMGFDPNAPLVSHILDKIAPAAG